MQKKIKSQKTVLYLIRGEQFNLMIPPWNLGQNFLSISTLPRNPMGWCHLVTMHTYVVDKVQSANVWIKEPPFSAKLIVCILLSCQWYAEERSTRGPYRATYKAGSSARIGASLCPNKFPFIPVIRPYSIRPHTNKRWRWCLKDT
jgi:hypothetical protein